MLEILYHFMLTPVTVFTGYLGSGKTTIIINLLKQLPKSYNAVMLKNEFGDIKVDSQLAKESDIEITEMINGCLCCVLVGQLNNALQEIVDKYNPDRIIIETSGSAYPAPIALEIREMKDSLHLDSIVTVIDAINFEGYEDKSYTAKLQTKFTDLILINKHEFVSERELEDVLDDVYDLNLDTPKVKTDRGVVDPDLIFGIDTKLFSSIDESANIKDEKHHANEVDLIEIKTDKKFEQDVFNTFLEGLSKSYFFRIKGMINFTDGPYLVNYVFGRFNFEKLKKYTGETQLIFMGEDLSGFVEDFIKTLGIKKSDITFIPKGE